MREPRFPLGFLFTAPVSAALSVLVLMGLSGPVAAVPRAYIPLAVAAGAGGKGLASAGVYADADLLNTSWHYTYSEATDPGIVSQFVPMAKDGDPSQCWPIVLLFNEPETGNPGEIAVTPQQASALVVDYQAACPASYTVIGNVSQYGLAWLAQTLALLPGYQGALGFHSFCWQTADDCVAVVEEFAAAFPATSLWLTETAIFHAYDTPGEVGRLMDGAFTMGVTRVAWFTNRVMPGDPWADREFYLLDAGALTPAGEAYRDFDG